VKVTEKEESDGQEGRQKTKKAGGKKKKKIFGPSTPTKIDRPA
jgi:hypothetical protein